MEGWLKQKLQGVDGVLCWRSRHFLLDTRSRCLAVEDANDGFIDRGGGAISSSAAPGVRGGYPDAGKQLPVTRVSLQGARYAVAWSGINAFNGCGFDLIWASGRIWSLLCEDPCGRKSWVDALNLVIRSSEHDPAHNAEVGDDTNIAPLSDRHKLRQCPKQNTVGAAAGLRCPPERSHAPPPPPSPPPPFPPLPRRKEAAAAGQFSSITSVANTGGVCRNKTKQNIFLDESDPPPSSLAGKERRGFGERQGGEGSSSGEWMMPHDDRAFVGAAVVDIAPDSERWQQQQQRRPRRRRRRKEETVIVASAAVAAAAATKPSPEMDLSEQGVSSPMMRTTPDTGHGYDRGGGAMGSSAGSSSTGCYGGSGSGRTSGRQNRAQERSEELARATAATWEQFQQLLQRSRQSKARFDRAIDGATGGAAAAETPDVVPPPCPRDKGGHGINGAGRVGVVERGTAPPPGSLGIVVGSRALVVEAAAMAAAAIEGRDGSTASAGSSSTDCASVVTPSRSFAKGSGTSVGNGGATAEGGGSRTAVDYLPSAGGCVYPAIDATEQSRISGVTDVTDVETSLLVDAREGSVVAEGDHPSTSEISSGSGGSIACSDTESEKRRRRFLPPSKLTPPPPPPRHHHRKQTVAEGGRGMDTPKRVQQLEAELEIARGEVVAAAQTESFLRRELAAAATAELEEVRRVREELAALKVSVREEREKEKEAASVRSLVVERERGEAVAAAVATATTTATAAASAAAAASDAMQSRVKAQLGDALKAAVKAEREGAAAVRQRVELEKSLAAEIGERRRVSDLLDERSRSEDSLRKRLDAEVQDGDSKARLASTRSELEAVSLERDALAEELDRCISRLGDQAREVASALRSRQQREIAEISSRCEIEKEALRERLSLEADEKTNETIRSALSVQEKRLRAEATAAARREAKLRDKQLREAKSEAEGTGEATRKDIEKLRGLHAKRVQRLEALLKEEGGYLADARREIAACKATLAGDAGDFQRWTEEQRCQSTRLLHEMTGIQDKIDGAVAMEAKAREREGLAMSRLRKVMEEARLERAEGAEVKRQLREAVAELESDRRAQARRARNDVQLQRAVEISKQEVAMLEAERVRWHEERRSMNTALERLTRLVYGSGNATTTATTNNGAAAKNASISAWKPAGGRRRVTAGATGHTSSSSSREACGSIGVNNAIRGGTRRFGSGKEAVLNAQGAGSRVVSRARQKYV